MLNPNINAYQKNYPLTWCGDLSTRDHILPGGVKIDAAQFSSADAVVVRVAAGGAAVDAVTIPIVALANILPSNQTFATAIPAGTVLSFGGKKYATLSAPASNGAVSLAVAALVTALVAGDTARYNAPNAPRRIRSGTCVGLTDAQLEGVAAGGALWHPADADDDVVRLVRFDVLNADINNDADILRPGSLIFVNNLPGWNDGTLSDAVKTKIRATYECSVSAPGQEVPAT